MTRLATLTIAAALVATPVVAHVHVDGLDIYGQCVGDASGDHTVAINELVLAVNNALGTCPALPVTINFAGMIGDQPFACGTQYADIGTGHSQFIPSDFRFYVSNVRLLDTFGTEVPVALEQDGVWQYQNVALLDFENGTGPCSNGNEALNTSIHGTVPSGVYTGVRFDLGLPFELNHGNASTAPSPLNFTAMFWTWQLGYKFLRVDTATDAFRIHLGSTGCEGESPVRPPTHCARRNVSTITLNNFNAQDGVIVADLAALLASSNIDVNEEGTPPGCMSDPDDDECVALLPNLGLDVASGTSSGTQTFFRVGEAGESEHVELLIASSSDGGGALVAHPEFDTSEAIPVPFEQCVGGTGDECDGGIRVYSTVNPGLSPIEASEPDESLYVLAGETPVTLEITAIDSPLVVKLGDRVLDGVGDSVELGTTPEFHADLVAQLGFASGSAPTGTFAVSFKLSTSNPSYQPSETVTLSFTPEGSHHD